MDMFDRLEAARKNTTYVVPGYLEKTLRQRLACMPGAAGSVYEQFDDPEVLLSALLTEDWEPYSHPAIAPGCEAFVALIPGRLGIVTIADMPAGTPVTLDDKKGTGKVSAVVRGVRGAEVDFTVLILGPEKDSEGHSYEVIYTFHPGDPIRPSTVSAEGMHGNVVTPAEAIALGLEMAKVE